MKRSAVLLIALILVLSAVLMPSTPALAMEQVLVGGHGNALNLTSDAEEYNSISGGGLWDAVANNRTALISAPGKIKSLFFRLSAAPGDADTEYYDLFLVLNDAPTALTSRIKNAETTGSNVINEIDVVAGDKVSLQCVTSNDAPDNTPYASWSMLFESTNAKESNILGSSRVEDDTTLRYVQVNNYGSNYAGTETENSVREVIPTAGTIKYLYVEMAADAGDDPDAQTFTLRIGGVDKIAVSIVADDVAGNNVADSVVVAAGDIVTMSVQGVNSPTPAQPAWWGLTFEATTDGESLILGGSNNDLNTTTTEYNLLDCAYYIRTWTATAADRIQLGQVTVLKKLYILLSADPENGDGAADKYVFTVKDEDAADTLTAEVVGGATTGNSGATTVTIGDGDTVQLECNPDSTPTVADAYWGLVSYIAPAPPPTPSGNETSRGYILD